MRYILASGSPRRKELLGKIIPEFEIIPAVSEEVLISPVPVQSPVQMALLLQTCPI